jgi:hypothetical protein
VNMTAFESANDDLAFVRRTVERAEPPAAPAVYLMWAVIVFAGGVLADFQPASVKWYWLAAAPLGFLASAAIGGWWQRRVGQLSPEAGRKEFLHWAALLGAVGLAALLAVAGTVTSRGLGSVMLLLVGFAYVQAGIHLHRKLAPVGLVVGAAYVLTLFAQPYEWTLAGLLVAAALTWQAMSTPRSDDTRR